MDEGAFDQNFTWFEWGFVSPDDTQSEDRQTPVEANGHTMAFRQLERWDEDHRWPT